MAFSRASRRATVIWIRPVSSDPLMRKTFSLSWAMSGGIRAGSFSSTKCDSVRVNDFNRRDWSRLPWAASMTDFNGFEEILSQFPLGHVARCPAFEGTDGELFAPVGRHQDDGQERVPGPDLHHQVEPVHLGHLQVGHDRVRVFPGDHLQGLPAVLGGHDRDPGRLPAVGPLLQ